MVFPVNPNQIPELPMLRRLQSTDDGSRPVLTKLLELLLEIPLQGLMCTHQISIYIYIYAHMLCITILHNTRLQDSISIYIHIYNTCIYRYVYIYTHCIILYTYHDIYVDSRYLSFYCHRPHWIQPPWAPHAPCASLPTRLWCLLRPPVAPGTVVPGGTGSRVSSGCEIPLLVDD